MVQQARVLADMAQHLKGVRAAKGEDDGRGLMMKMKDYARVFQTYKECYDERAMPNAHVALSARDAMSGRAA